MTPRAIGRSLLYAASVLLVATASHAGPPANWKKMVDRHNKCVAYVPPDWSVGPGAANAAGHVAGITMNSNQTKARADGTWGLYKPRLDVLEDKPNRRMGVMKESGKGVSYLVQAMGDGFVCNAFVEVDQAKDLAKYGPIVKQIAESVAPGQ